jgi:glutamine---fructose-6-phosphate transaminase (isomerizing)
VAIFRAHKAAPLVIANDGEDRFNAALQVLPVPAVHPSLDFVLSAMAGHLFGYEAALAIDAQARMLREARGVVEDVIASSREAEHVLGELRHRLEPVASRFFEQLRNGSLNGHLEASTAVRLSSLFRYALGLVPIESYEIEYGKLGSPAAVVDDLTAALTSGIEELTRPVDAIKHQAKTVTVGISRSEDAFVQVPLVREALSAGSGRDRIGYKALRTLAALDPAVAEVTGFTRYALDGDEVSVVDKGGVAVDIPSRTPGPLKGTKRRAATEREVTVARGYDGRTVIHIPEVKDNQVVGITLLHARFHDHLPTDAMRSVLSGYRGRYDAVVDAVTESEPTFRDEVLAEVPVIDLLVEPVHVLARHWR